MASRSAWVALSWLTVVAGRSAVTPISPAHPELLQQGIVSAYAAGQAKVVVPAGVYMIPSLASGRHLDLENMNNFEIDATGAAFVFQDQTLLGLYFNKCNGVNFHGATLYYATPPFSQGVIQATAANGSSFDVQIEAGYPTNLDDPNYFTPQIIGHLFDSSTRWWKRNVYGDIYGSQTQRLSANSFRIFSSSLAGAAVGDLIGFRSGVGDHIVRVTSSSNMTLANLTILNSAAFAIAETLGGDQGANHYRNVTVQRGVRPAGATTDPLFSTSADGIHSTEARQGPDIENCTLEAMADDGIAVHGHFSWVMQASGNTLIVSNTTVASGTNFKPGDPLRLVDANDQLAGDAVVTAVTALPNFQNTRKSARQTVRDFTVGPYYQLTLDRALAAGFDYLAANPNASGAGFTLRNNTIRNHRARGMNLKGDNGTVEGNVIDGSTMAGIRAGPEFYWSESGYMRNLVLRNNTIDDVTYWGGQTAAMLIAPDQGLTPAGGYQNILIDGNLFENFNITALFLSSTSGAVIGANQFQNLETAPAYAVDNLGEDVNPGTLIYAAKSNEIQLQANSVSTSGSNAVYAQAGIGVQMQGGAYVSNLAGSNSGFSGTQGMNGWWYGYFPAGNLGAFTQLPEYNASAQRWQHTTFGPPWTLVGANSAFHPNGANNGAEEWATRRWTSAFSGTATISGHLAKNDTSAASTGIYGRVYQNGKMLYQKFIQGTDGVGADYSIQATLNSGDNVDFSVAPNGVDTSDSTVFSSTVSAIVTPPVNTGGPSISAVTSAAAGESGGAPGTYLSIYGANFAPAGFSDDWSHAVNGGKLPTSLDGVSVAIGGAAAYIQALTATQINVFTPNLAAGSAAVTVTTMAGATPPFYTAITAGQPEFFPWPVGQPVATHTDFSYAAKNGSFAAPTVPAAPGETIILWGCGFGATNPTAPVGQVVPAGSYVVGGVAVTIGGQPVTVLGSALAPGLAGVYQIAIQIPATIADGDYPLVATVAGAQTPVTTLTVQVR